MRTAIISDIHSNVEALEAVLRRIDEEHVDEIVCLGDIIGYGPDPNRCIALVRAHCSTVILGNHDEWGITIPDHALVPEAVWQSIQWTAHALEDEHKSWIAGLPLIFHREEKIFVHAAPRSPGLWEYIIDAASASKYFPVIGTSTCFVGHSHIPGEYASTQSTDEVHGMSGERRGYIINVGSIGQPRDGNPAACFYINDEENPEELKNQRIRVDYEIQIVAEKIRNRGLPEFFSTRLFIGR